MHILQAGVSTCKFGNATSYCTERVMFGVLLGHVNRNLGPESRAWHESWHKLPHVVKVLQSMLGVLPESWVHLGQRLEENKKPVEARSHHVSIDGQETE